MLVGDVRCATTGLGSSWKLSGGSALSSAPTNASKNRQVRRPIRRRAATSSAESWRPAVSAGGRLIARATSGDTSQRTTNGSASHDRLGLRRSATATSDGDREGDAPGHLAIEAADALVDVRLGLGGGRPLEQLASASRTRRVRARPIASAISHAWWARNVQPRPTWAAARPMSAPTAPKVAALRDPLPARQQPGRRPGAAPGSAMVARTNPVQSGAETAGHGPGDGSVAMASGADSVRRRLSIIFHRPMAGTEPRRRGPWRRGRARGSTAGAASRRVPSGAGARRRPGSGRGTRRRARCR